MILLGLDPGLRATGWGILHVVDNRLRWLADGVVCSDEKSPLVDRLAQLYAGVTGIIGEFGVEEAAVEETFVNRNPASTLKLAQARGAVLAAVGGAGLAVMEYAPRLVKKSVAGTGAAAKEQIGMMVRQLLPGCLPATPDAADALAVAICHAHLRTRTKLLEAALGGRR